MTQVEDLTSTYTLPDYVTAVKVRYNTFLRGAHDQWFGTDELETRQTTEDMLCLAGPHRFYRDVDPRDLCECTDAPGGACVFHRLTGALPPDDVIAAATVYSVAMWLRIHADDWEDVGTGEIVHTGTLLRKPSGIRWLVEKA